MGEKFGKSRVVKTSDGSVRYVFDGKLHNWEGPALIPEGNMRKREYYLYGILFSELSLKICPTWRVIWSYHPSNENFINPVKSYDEMKLVIKSLEDELRDIQEQIHQFNSLN